MKVRFFGLLVLSCVLAIVTCLNNQQRTYSQTKKATSPSLSQAEQDLLNEINQARAHPQVYATYLEKLKPLFNGKQYTAAGQGALDTQEGWSAVEDAIKFLRSAKSLGPLSASQGLSLAASMHVKDQGSSGATGHKGSDSTFIEQRVKPFGSWQGGIGENLTYGNESARERILTWLIDDGFASRGHRNRLLSENYRVAGISCGPHPEFGTMCVVTLAGGFIDSAAAEPVASKSATSNAATRTTNSNKNGTARKPRR
ncbi:MAG TPA: CAP domain-containing protein [Pyrinomonadaceae bacterium]|nr:CAP domain-containing protein [Pyrinomonadaceae bacterium]